MRYGDIGSPMRVMLVDDDVPSAEAMSFLLESKGVACDIYNDPQSALDQLKSGDRGYHIVITDYLMPKMNGICFSMEVLKNNAMQDVVLMTGTCVTSRDKEMIKDTRIRLLKKPLRIQTLFMLLDLVQRLD